MSSSLQKTFEAELAANPDDLATHAAYADLLSEQGDPRGEFIQVQLALEDPSLNPAQRRQLQEREQDLLTFHHERWLGRMSSFLHEHGNAYSFRRGWLDTLEVGLITLPLARALRDAPEACLLRELSIRSAKWVDPPESHAEDGVPEGESYPGYWPLVGSPNLANVTRFSLGDSEPTDDYQYFNCTDESPVVPHLLRGMPRLQEAHLFVRGYNLTDLFALPLKHLRVLEVYHCSQVYRLDVLARNPSLAGLTHLLCHPHALAWHDNRAADEAAGFREEEGYLPLSVVRTFLHSAPPSLTHLQLRVSSMGDAGCEEIVRSGILGRLKRLDLRHGRITDRGARLLADCPDIRRLEHLDLGWNALSSAGVALLEGLGISVLVHGQHDSADEETDLSDADEYLHEGDIE